MQEKKAPRLNLQKFEQQKKTSFLEEPSLPSFFRANIKSPSSFILDSSTLQYTYDPSRKRERKQSTYRILLFFSRLKKKKWRKKWESSEIQGRKKKSDSANSSLAGCPVCLEHTHKQARKKGGEGVGREGKGGDNKCMMEARDYIVCKPNANSDSSDTRPPPPTSHPVGSVSPDGANNSKEGRGRGGAGRGGGMTKCAKPPRPPRKQRRVTTCTLTHTHSLTHTFFSGPKRKSTSSSSRPQLCRRRRRCRCRPSKAFPLWRWGGGEAVLYVCVFLWLRHAPK